MDERRTRLCIVGGGPAGMFAGLLFARAGVETVVLEKHGDFLRDFRGDTVHPSTFRLFHEMGLLDRLLERPHDKVHRLGAFVGDRYVKIADFSRFDPRWNFIAMMPQWDFLDFVAGEARLYPNFQIIMNAEARGLITENGRVAGVRFKEKGTERKIRADLVIASDGRRSVLREEAGFKIRSLGAPMDVFWFRLPKAHTPDNRSTGIFVAGRIMALIDRGDYWQCAYVFGKGQEASVKAAGLDAFRVSIARAAPMMADAVDAIQSWDDVKLLSVALDRLEAWHKPGLLVIGDAAHAMSPIGGVGINVAVQDAVAAANILAAPMARGEDVDGLLGKVEKRRRLQVRTIQAFQDTAQKRIIQPLLAEEGGAFEPPRIFKWLDRLPWLRRIPAAFLGFGIRPEHIMSPQTKSPPP
ncbi:FAD-dependent oxidoreductase [Allosphingosinicella vermicomposti]|uniref:FAD-dependent oxidoreductase n=1 Tax=Allosphingosinicella vermicomposti TaxID=614671 RepID=UPI000D10D2E1|nr:FAD-dependent oxidoreductase [Allosphingosinicella vermicomposti]